MRVPGRRELNRTLLARQLLLSRVLFKPVRRSPVSKQAGDAPYVGLWSRLEDFRPEQLASMVTERRAVRMPLMRRMPFKAFLLGDVAQAGERWRHKPQSINALNSGALRIRSRSPSCRASSNRSGRSRMPLSR